MKRKASPSQVVEEERLQKKPRREDPVVGVAVSLPQGVNESIFSFLDAGEKSYLRSVCTDWFKIIDKTYFEIGCILPSELNSLVDCFSRYSKPIGLRFNKTYKLKAKDYAPIFKLSNLTSLEIYPINNAKEGVKLPAVASSDLQKLVVRSVDPKVFAKLPNLKHLETGEILPASFSLPSMESVSFVDGFAQDQPIPEFSGSTTLTRLVLASHPDIGNIIPQYPNLKELVITNSSYETVTTLCPLPHLVSLEGNFKSGYPPTLTRLHAKIDFAEIATELATLTNLAVQLPDASSTNELQTLSLSSDNSELAISNGNTVTLPDSSSTNELQSLSISGTSLSISNGNSVQLPITPAQTLSLSPDKTTLSVSDGNSITLPDSSNTNELQTLSLTGSQLSLSAANSVDLSAVSSTRAAFTTIPHNTELPLTLSQLASLTVTPPAVGSVLTRLCGVLATGNAAYHGVVINFANATQAVGDPSYWESLTTDYRSFCAEKWWPITTPGVPVTYNVQGYRGVQSIATKFNGDAPFSVTFFPQF